MACSFALSFLHVLLSIDTYDDIPNIFHFTTIIFLRHVTILWQKTTFEIIQFTRPYNHTATFRYHSFRIRQLLPDYNDFFIISLKTKTYKHFYYTKLHHITRLSSIFLFFSRLWPWFHYIFVVIFPTIFDFLIESAFSPPPHPVHETQGYAQVNSFSIHYNYITVLLLFIMP